MDKITIIVKMAENIQIQLVIFNKYELWKIIPPLFSVHYLYLTLVRFWLYA